MRRTALVLLLGGNVVSLGAQARDQPPQRLTLADAVARARAHSARLGQLRALGDAAAAGERGAHAARVPQVELSAGYTRNSNVPELTLTIPGQGTRTLFPNIPDAWRTRAFASVPVYTGGRLEAASDAARSLERAAGFDLGAAENDLVLETVVSYWSLATARASEIVLGEALVAFEKHVSDARARAEVGLAARNEVLSVEVEHERAELQRVQARSAAEVAQAQLAYLVGLAPGEIVEPLDAPGAVSGSAADTPALIAAALASRPELQAQRARVEAARAQERVQRAARLPQASASAAYDLARPNTRVLPLRDTWETTWSLGVGLSWNAFDGGRTAAAVAQARAQAGALALQLEDLERRVRLDVTQRVLELQSAEAALLVSARAQASAAENARVAADRYREGVGSSTDLLDAETGLLRAGLERTAAQTGVEAARARLERALGRPGRQ